jgi:gamma-glutamyl hydrolase
MNFCPILVLLFLTASPGSRLYDTFSPVSIGWISSEPITFNSHHWGVTTETFNSNQKLNQFFTVLSTNKDRKGVEFISSMEGMYSR